MKMFRVEYYNNDCKACNLCSSGRLETLLAETQIFNHHSVKIDQRYCC